MKSTGNFLAVVAATVILVAGLLIALSIVVRKNIQRDACLAEGNVVSSSRQLCISPDGKIVDHFG